MLQRRSSLTERKATAGEQLSSKLGHLSPRWFLSFLEMSSVKIGGPGPPLEMRPYACLRWKCGSRAEKHLPEHSSVRRDRLSVWERTPGTDTTRIDFVR